MSPPALTPASGVIPMPFRDKIFISDAPSDLQPPPYPHSPAHLFLSPVLEAALQSRTLRFSVLQDDTEALCDLLLRHHLTPNRPCQELCTLPVVYHPQALAEEGLPQSSPGPWSSYPPPRTRTLLFRSLALLSPPLTHARTTTCIDPSE